MSNESREIRIVTGPGGQVQGSKVYLDGQELTGLCRVEIKGEIGGYWELGTTQILASSGLPKDSYLDMEEDSV